MTIPDLERQVEQNVQEFERRQASVLHNPALARLYIERGACVGLVFVLTISVTWLRIEPFVRNLLYAGSFFCAAVATALISIGVNGLIQQHRQATAPIENKNEPKPIGW
jgi:hypothetical protein